MKQRQSRVWFHTNHHTGSFLHVASATMGQDSFEILANNEGTLGAGSLRLARVIGTLSLAGQNLVAGAASLHFWHGIWHGDVDQLVGDKNNLAGSTSIAQKDSNNEDWLWREPVSENFATVSGGGWRFYQRFDWAVRGGHGSNLMTAQKFIYVLASHGSGLQEDNIQWSTSMLQLWIDSA